MFKKPFYRIGPDPTGRSRFQTISTMYKDKKSRRNVYKVSTLAINDMFGDFYAVKMFDDKKYGG